MQFQKFFSEKLILRKTFSPKDVFFDFLRNTFSSIFSEKRFLRKAFSCFFSEKRFLTLSPKHVFFDFLRKTFSWRNVFFESPRCLKSVVDMTWRIFWIEGLSWTELNNLGLNWHVCELFNKMLRGNFFEKCFLPKTAEPFKISQFWSSYVRH